MKHIYSFAFVLFMLFASSTQLSAQTTGSFDTTITFMSASRAISFHVPTTYNASNAYKLMVCLHGLGDNSANYRNALINSLGWATYFPNTIFVCPESATTSSDYYSATGTEQIILESINLAKAKYNIDPAQVVLQGFSLGGRAALRYGLDHTSDFEGLLLNTPAIQGSKNGINGLSYYTFNYANANDVPIYITHGATDDLYTSPIDSMVEQLILNNGVIHFVRVPALAHAIPSFSQMPMVSTFFTNPTPVDYDLAIAQVKIPNRTCQPQVTPSVLVHNVGSSTLTSIELEYTYNGNTLSHIWTGSLAPFQHNFINLPSLSLVSGAKDLEAKVKFLNVSHIDTVTPNNQALSNIQYADQGKNLPFSEGFEGTTFPPADFVFERVGDDYTYFDVDDIVFKTGAKSVYAFNTILLFDNSGRKAEMLSPVLNLLGNTTPNISFDMAYNYQRYTPPYFTADTDFTDTLDVLISTDCGNTYQSLYRKWGSQLATFANPILNPLNVQACFINPKDTNWRHVELDLSAYASATEAVVKFSYISGLGGNINIDNINFSTTPLVLNTLDKNTLQVFPNPASDVIHITNEASKINDLTLIDIQGNQATNAVKQQRDAHHWLIDTHSLADGIYVVNIFTEQGKEVRKIHVQH